MTLVAVPEQAGFSIDLTIYMNMHMQPGPDVANAKFNQVIYSKNRSHSCQVSNTINHEQLLSFCKFVFKPSTSLMTVTRWKDSSL